MPGRMVMRLGGIMLGASATLAVMSFTGAAVAGQVVGRYAFYSDPLTVAANKQALTPGQTAAYANITNKMPGLIGVAVDMVGIGGSLAHSDFVFRVGNSMSPSLWEPLTNVPTISIVASAGAGGSDRVALVFAAGVVRDQWLQVSVLANKATGLGSPDVFYFGNLAGDVTGDLAFTSLDVLTVVDFLNTSGPQFVGVDSPLDVTGDGFVSSLDSLALINEMNSTGPKSLLLLEPPRQGDANGDGVVDLDDFVILKRNFGTTAGAAWAMGDFNGDGAVDLDDFVILKQNFGTFVPEPATALPALGGAALLRRRRR